MSTKGKNGKKRKRKKKKGNRKNKRRKTPSQFLELVQVSMVIRIVCKLLSAVTQLTVIIKRDTFYIQGLVSKGLVSKGSVGQGVCVQGSESTSSLTMWVLRGVLNLI